MLDVYVKMVLSLCEIKLFVTFKSLFILMNFIAHFYAASRTIEQTWCLSIPWQTRWFDFPASPIFYGKSPGDEVEPFKFICCIGWW